MPRISALFLLLLCFAPTVAPTRAADAQAALHVVVMDPLSDQLACDCVAGYAQRQYSRLGAFLEGQLDRKVYLAHAESLGELKREELAKVDVIIGKFSLVRYDARLMGLKIRSLAMLSDQEGEITQRGLFVVRTDDKAKSIQDIGGHRLLFGPNDCDEKNAAAVATLDAFGLPIPAELPIATDCTGAALAVAENDADVGVISDYAMPLLEGCEQVAKGELRVIGSTASVPFIGVFATDSMSARVAKEFVTALDAVASEADLLKAMESKSGFVPLPHDYGTQAPQNMNWTQWRGHNRNAITADVPKQLPATRQLLWSRVMTGHGLAGLAVYGGRIIVADKSLDQDNDIFRCLDADTGRQLWTIEYAASGKMDYTNAPRANPLIDDGVVYLLGAYGHLNCVELDTGSIVWKRNLAEDFDAFVPTWGYCSSPLIVDDKLIVNPGAKDASIVALDKKSGRVIWQTAGQPCGYASFVLASVNNDRQIIGYEATSLCGYAPETGNRLWSVVPEREGDFNVGTPIVLENQLLVATENNGTRLYRFNRKGRLRARPFAQNFDMNPDKSTPVVYQGMVIGNFDGLACLDLENELQTCWESFDDAYLDYCSLIAGNDRVLVISQTGSLKLLEPNRQELRCVSELDLFDDVPARDRDVWSHPALVGNRLYIRNSLAAYCFLLN